MTEYLDPEPDLETVAPVPQLPEPSAPPGGGGAAGPREPSPPSGSRRATGFIAALVVVALVVGFATATLVLDARDSGSDRAAAQPGTTSPATGSPSPTFGTVPGSTAPAVPADPDSSVLGGLILQQREMAAGNTVTLIPQGADLTEPTLDICNGTFPSESQRRARRQVALVTQSGTLVAMSTEAVLYRTPSVGAQALAELQSVAAHCPSGPVTSPVGEVPVATKFAKAPDTAWPRTPTVDRLAFDMVTTTTGATPPTAHSVAVYLRRGRVLLGLYFTQPDGAQAPVAGRTTIPGIVALFEARMANVPESVVSR